MTREQMLILVIAVAAVIALAWQALSGGPDQGGVVDDHDDD